MSETQTSETQTQVSAKQTSTIPSSEAVARMTLIETRLANERKSTVLAYILWLFLGTLGAHCFYLGKTGQGLFRLLAFVVAIFLMFSGPAGMYLGFLIIGILGIWALIDAFLIPRMIRKDTEQRRQRLENLLFNK